MTTNNEVYAVAKKHLGHHGSHARAYCGLSGGQPYCCAFVCMCFHGAKADKLFYGGKRCTYCPSAIMWCEDNLAEIPPYLAMRMDLIFFDWQPNGTPDHIGFVLDKISTDKIRTLEGNTSGGIVAIKTRGGYIQGIFRPHYKPDKELKKGKLTVDGDFGYHSIYMLQAALGITQDGILGKKTVKALQKKVGAMPDGAWGPKTSRQIQAKLCGFKGKDLDGEFGPKSVQALQRWANSINYPSTEEKPAEIKSAPTAALKSSAAKSDTAASKTKPKTSAKEGYTGKFPTLNNNRKIVNGLAYRLCYPYKTAQKKYKFSTGKPKEAYKKAIDKAYPNHKKWSNKRQRAGACCDVFVGTCLRLVGINVKKDLKNQLVDMPKLKSLKSNGHHKAKDFKLGDVVQRGRKDKSGHTWIVCELVNGKRYVANSHYKHLHGCYAVMDAKPKSIDPKDWKYYKCYTVQGAIRTYYKKGDYGHDVVYIQKFLKWAGFFKGSCNGDFNGVTEKAVKKFKKHVGLKQSGHVGKDTIKKMKAYKK